jgi:hypothetical protein
MPLTLAKICRFPDRIADCLAAPMLKAALGTFCLVAMNAHAAEIQVYPDSESETTLILVEGSIVKGDEKKFRKIAAEHSDAIIVLDSDGGAIVPAMDIGRTIRLREYSTVVYKDGRCTSACALIWAAGIRRVIFEGGKVGFHARLRTL